MVPEVKEYGNEITLIMNTGIQFVDFNLNVDEESPVLKRSIDFVRGALIPQLKLDENGTSDFSVKSKVALDFFNGHWIPVPFLRTVPPNRFDKGPSNWSRVQIVKLQLGEDVCGNTHRVTFAFDTKAFETMVEGGSISYLGPLKTDIETGAIFKLATQNAELDWFLEKDWVQEWLSELFSEIRSEPRDGKKPKNKEDIEFEIKNEQSHLTYYLTLLDLLKSEIALPSIKLGDNRSEENHPIPVDLILDIGNSRTCGVLIEDYGNANLPKFSKLQIRNLTHPQYAEDDPFNSRVEFCQASFGKDHVSIKSGLGDAFNWQSITRIGAEAVHLASLRKGNEGSTGLSSPKRYLWDKNLYTQGWKFNSHYSSAINEPPATAEPFSSLMNEYGEALYTIPDDCEDYDRAMPVFEPKYAKSSLMTFMISEVLMHTICQINSVSYRYALQHARSPRYLRSLILTIPPGMTRPEQSIFKAAVEQAVGLIWKSYNWLDWDFKLKFTNGKASTNGVNVWPPIPEVSVEWDEATAGQVVYLYNEIDNTYNGRAEEFFKAIARPDREPNKIRIATVDIGGGTTDIVINDYIRDFGDSNAEGSNANLTPKQCFRDGFGVAGDDILLDIIQTVIINNSLKAKLDKLQLSSDSILSGIIGTANTSIQEETLRQQLTLQIFVPVGLAILEYYENYNPIEDGKKVIKKTIRELLGLIEFSDSEENQDKVHNITDSVLRFVNDPIKRQLKRDFCILDLEVSINLHEIHHKFFVKNASFNICKSFDAICELISCYNCDVLLLTGRPSRLPGVLSYFKASGAMASGRILPMHGYRTGGWYPFHKEEKIDDPKTTAVVGAMLCYLSRKLRLPNFYFKSTLIKLYSTVKNIGLIDNSNMIKKENVYYQNVDLDNEDYDFPDDQTFEVRGTTRIGFRQLDNERWPAALMYYIVPEGKGLEYAFGQAGFSLKVSLGIKNKEFDRETGNFYIKEVEAVEPENFKKGVDSWNKGNVKLYLNTMLSGSLTDLEYWLDSGILKK